MNRLNPNPIIDIGPLDIPEACLPESATQNQLCRYLVGTAESFGRLGYSGCPLTLFFNIVGERNTRDRVFIVTLDEAVRDAITRDLDTVTIREAAPSGFKRLKLDAGPETSFGSIFQQLADVPMSLFGLNCPDPRTGKFLFAHFFIRGANTITELKREMHWARLIEVDAKPAQNSAEN